MSSWDQARRKQDRRTTGATTTRVLIGILAGFLLLAGIGIGVLTAATWPDADAAGRAPLCTSASGPGEDCVSWTNAKIVSFVKQGGKHAVYELDVADDGTGLPESFSFQSSNALLADNQIGTAVQVESWKGHQIAVKAGALLVQTSDSPAIERADFVAGTMMCLGLASFLLAVTFGNAGSAAARRRSARLGTKETTAAALLRRSGRVSAVCTVAVICWSVAVVAVSFVVIANSLTVNATFAVGMGVFAVVDLAALPFVLWHGSLSGA